MNIRALIDEYDDIPPTTFHFENHMTYIVTNVR